MKTPVELHGVATPEAYKVKQRQTLARTRTGRPHTASAEGLPILVQSNDTAVIVCPCGGYPLIHPDWQLACCFRCGAIYESVVVPGTP